MSRYWRVGRLSEIKGKGGNTRSMFLVFISQNLCVCERWFDSG